MSKMKKILVVTCTKGDGKNTQLVQSLSPLTDDVKLVVNINNECGLSKAYNKQLTPDNLIHHDIVLFAHDDVFIDDLKLKGKLYTAIDELQYDIVGLAGASEVKISKPCLWHRMSTRESWSGAVSHQIESEGTSKLHVTSFGPWPRRCLILDGLFLAVDLKRALEVDWKFNENYDFHHYDISSCLDANQKKLKLGTYPIHTTHMSPGLKDYNDSVYQKSEQTFYKEYKSG